MMRVAIVQSSYIPWKGYFDLVRASDVFVLLDDVQYTRRDWRNRNRIKTQHGPAWLTIHVQVKGKFTQKIRDVVVAGHDWRADHWQRIAQSYRRATFFDRYAAPFAALYLNGAEEHLSEINERFIRELCAAFGITTPMRQSNEFVLADGPTERLVSICSQLNATEYLSGPAARAYLDEGLFADAGIAVRYADYSQYPEYPQPFPPFEHQVSAVDLLFSTGPDALRYMRTITD